MPELNQAGALKGVAWQSREWKRLANRENSTVAHALSERIRSQCRALSRLKDCDVIAVVDENAPEEPRGQLTIEPFDTHILSDASETKKMHLGQFE